MKGTFDHASASFKKRNPNLFTPLTSDDPEWNRQGIVPPDAKPSRRLRQSSRPLLNQLESDFMAVLKERYPGIVIHAQAMRFKLAAGAWYKPDLCLFTRIWTAFEVKCFKGKNVARGILALKCAAHQFPEICFVLVWKDDGGQWREEIVRS